jgi:hypothetical protein
MAYIQIRIRIGFFLNDFVVQDCIQNPDPGSGSITKKLYFLVDFFVFSHQVLLWLQIRIRIRIGSGFNDFVDPDAYLD